jgi:predicted ABC-type ATPase
LSESAPVLVVVAGPNGSGKSTLTRAMLENFPIVDPDAIAREATEMTSDLQAGRTALLRVKEHIFAKESFVIETTMSGNWVLETMRRAKAARFQVELHFVGLDQVETAILRVRDRVAKGGHDIALADQRRRFPRAFYNLAHAAKISDRTWLYDNSTKEGFRELVCLSPHSHPAIQSGWPLWAKTAVKQISV